MLKNSTVTSFSHENESSAIWRKSNLSRLSCALPLHRRECTSSSFWTLSKTYCPQSAHYRHYWFIHSCKIQEKTVVSVIIRTCNFGFRSYLFFCTKNSFAVSSVWKNTPFPIFATLHFKKLYEYKASDGH